jgi:indole-3-glycerol phosphate synthase
MILDKIVRQTRASLREDKRKIDLLALRDLAEAALIPVSFLDAMKAPGLSVIGELKQASPSKGMIRESLNIPEILTDYNQVMSAVSVLTEPHFFMGSRENFEEARRHTHLPLLRKDFFIDPVQIYQAKAWGASCILLIAKILDTGQMKEFQAIANELGMAALVEVHDEEDLDKALKIDADLIGINNRDLRHFTIDLATTVRLRQLIPKDKIVISESGIRKSEDLMPLNGIGISGVLVGEMFMRSQSIVADVKELKDGFKTQA